MLELPVVKPFPWQLLLNYLSFRCIPIFENVENNCYRRLYKGVLITVSYDELRSVLLISSETKLEDFDDILLRVSHLFHPHISTAAVFKQLVPQLPIISESVGFRPLGCWDSFELCVRTIIGQQVSVAAANTIMRRLMDRCGELTPTHVQNANLDKLGMPRQRVQCIANLARAVSEGEIDFSQAWPGLNQALAKLPGLGPWTRGYLAIRLGRDDDAFPETDAGLIRVAGAGNAKVLLHKAESWRPYRAYAAACLWSLG